MVFVCPKFVWGERQRLISLVTAQGADGSLRGWDFFCEEDDRSCGDVWTLRDGVLVCRGLPRGYIVNRATRCGSASGSLCLTAEGDEIHFRKIELIEK